MHGPGWTGFGVLLKLNRHRSVFENQNLNQMDHALKSVQIDPKINVVQFIGLAIK